MQSYQDSLIRSFENCDRAAAWAAMEGALSDGAGLEGLFPSVVHPALERLGSLWSDGRVTLTQIYVAARIVEEAAERFGARFSPAVGVRGKVVMGGLIDGHRLGARLVRTFLHHSGIEVIEAGYQLSPAALAGRAVAESAQVLGVSAFFLSSARRVPDVKQELARLGADIKLVAGGAPFRADPTLAGRLGADGWAPDAVQAVSVIRALLKAEGGGGAP